MQQQSIKGKQENVTKSSEPNMNEQIEFKQRDE